MTGPVLGASPHGFFHSPDSCDGGMIPPITQHMTRRRKTEKSSLKDCVPPIRSHGLGGIIETNCSANPQQEVLALQPIPPLHASPEEGVGHHDFLIFIFIC